MFKCKFFIFILLAASFLCTSCGQKGQATKTNFKIFSGNMIDPVSTFPGGLLLLGRHSDGSQSFVLAFKPGLELELKKGKWEFATIGWMGANPMEGNQQCSYQTVDINTDLFSVNFNMNYQACLNATTFEGKRFSHPLFYNTIGQTFNGFKKLQVKTCADLDLCSSQATPISFRVDIQPMLKGIVGTAGVAGLSSVCISSAFASNITPPHGGAGGFIGLMVTTFSASACSGTPKAYFFDHGFGEILNRSYLISGTTILRRGALSVDTASLDAGVALAPFYGTHSLTNVSAPSTGGARSLYLYDGASVLTATPTGATSGMLLYFNGSTWSKFSDTDSVKLLLQD